ncbi:uncharacterized protein LOC128226210 [Mya arenaria]|uniref:uncharacterized protein LOC128226210 n=1 Tax=Mya arenaria TaxID=6604 RepID=UPI0022E01E14|nr:uncharacterized protein LOC128226210 [Mya arenaria]
MERPVMYVMNMAVFVFAIGLVQFGISESHTSMSTFTLNEEFASSRRPEGNESFFKNCNRTEAFIYGHNLTFSPNPIVLHPDPKNFSTGPSLQFYGKIEISRSISNNERIELLNSIKLTTLGYETTELCLWLPLRFCHSNDLCGLIEDYRYRFKNHCPVLIYDKTEHINKAWNCSCPIIEGIYWWPDFKFQFPQQHVRLEGDFDIDINLKQGRHHIGCLNFKFSFSKGSQDPSAYD